MAPLPANSTASLYVDYTVCTVGHTMQIRFGTGSSATEAISVADAFLTALDDTIRVLTIDGCRVRDIGTSVTYPVTWTGAASYGAGAGARYEGAYFYDFVGRSLGGRRGRVSVFGAVSKSTSDDYRYAVGEYGALDAALATLEAFPEAPVAIDGDTINFQQYINLGMNAYWRNKLR